MLILLTRPCELSNCGAKCGIDTERECIDLLIHLANRMRLRLLYR